MVLSGGHESQETIQDEDGGNVFQGRHTQTHVPHLYVMICTCKELKHVLYIPFIFMHYDFLFMFTVPKVKPRLSISIV